MNFNEYKERKLNENKKIRKEYFKLKKNRELSYEIGKNIRKTRQAQHITQKSLAKLLGTHQPSVARVENGSQLPSILFLKKISDALRVTLNIGFGVQKRDAQISSEADDKIERIKPTSILEIQNPVTSNSKETLFNKTSV